MPGQRPNRAASRSFKAKTPVSVLDFGAVPDWNGSSGTDNSRAFNNAIAAMIGTDQTDLYVPSGSYYFNGCVTIPARGKQGNDVFRIHGDYSNDLGDGPKGSILIFASCGIVQHNVSYIRYEDLMVMVLASGGPNITLSGRASFTSLSHVVLTSRNPSRQLILGRTAGDGEIEGISLGNFELTPATGHTVPAVDFLNNSGNSEMNYISVRDGLVHGSPTATAPIIKMECRFSGCYQNAIENVLFEVVPAGAIEWLSIDNSALVNVSEADSPDPTAPFITLAASSAPNAQDENGVTIINPTVGVGTITQPSLLIDNTAHPYPGQFTIVGGILPYTRVKGMGAALPLAINVRSSDPSGLVILSADNNYGTGFFINSSTANGTMSFGGQWQKGGCTAGTDLVVSAADDLKVSSRSYNFTTFDASGYIAIEGGAGWSPGSYRIVSISNNAAVLDHSPAHAGATGGQWDVNRGRIGFVRGSSGVGDGFYACMKGANDSYSWVAVQ
jgi:hypothetical protein